MTIQSTKERFEQALDAGGGWIRMDSGDVDLRVGIDDGKRAILLRTATKPPTPPELAVLKMERRQVEPGNWLLVIRLERSELAALFTVLADDLAYHTARAKSENPAQVVLTRLLAWQRLLAKAPNGVLPEPRLRGLLAELVMLTEAIDRLGIRDAVLSWHGPAKAPQDFGFGFLRVEVKAVHAVQASIQISSPEQLSSEGCPMMLRTQVLELVGERDPEAIMVAEYVRGMASLVSADARALEQFERGLFEYGYVDLPAYTSIWFRPGVVTEWDVDDGFPRVTRAQLPAAVDELSYSLDVSLLPPSSSTAWASRVPG